MLATIKSIEEQIKKISSNFPQDLKPLQKLFKPWINQASRSFTVALNTVIALAGNNLVASAGKRRAKQPTVNISSVNASANT